MRNVFSFIFFTIFSVLHANALDKNAQNVSAFLAKNGWQLSENKTNLALPFNDITPIHFFSKAATSPSCGLLIEKESEISFVEILLTEPNDQYPHCASIKDAASFKWGDRQYLLAVYTEKDSRDEIYDRFFFIYQDRSGQYHVDKQLNEMSSTAEPVKKNPKRVGLHGTWYMATAEEGVRLAKAALIRNAVPSMNFLDRDFIAGRESSFAVLEDDKRQKCLFIVENSGNSAKYGSDLFAEDGKCIDFLASGKSKKGEKTYFLGIFESAGKARNIAVFSIAQDGVIRDERELAVQMRSAGKANDIKTAKTYLQEISLTSSRK